MFLASKRELMQAAQQLSISANAARGKPKEIERTIKEWKQKSE